MSDLNLATRELFIRTRINQVFMKTPFIDELQSRKKVVYKGGKYIERLMETKTTEDLVQEYTANTALRDEKKDVLEKARFYRKYAQYPLRYDVDEYLENIVAGSEEQLADLSKLLVEKGNEGIKLYLDAIAWNNGSTTPIADGAGVLKFQSVVSALNHDTAYGTLSRTFSSNVNDYWQSSDPAGLTENITSSSQDTAYQATLANLDKWIYETNVMHNMQSADDLRIYCCPTLYNKYRAQMEARGIYEGGSGNTGITSMKRDGYQIVSVPYLQKTTTMKTWLFILNLKDWELRIDTERNFKMTDFKWQAEQSNGYDFWLARIMWAGNLICWKPQGSLWLSNVS